jgi:hypothetical protein
VVEIESIAGRWSAGEDAQVTWFVITYSDGDEEHRQGTHHDASELASAAGLVIVPTAARSSRWMRSPAAARIPHSAA